MSTRLGQLDGLRCIAALVVVAYHYTTRFDERFAHTQVLPFELSWGSLGVELFFVISGFVIFMTLDRSRTPGDFAVSRFSRLFPTYWAAMLITWCVITLADVPGTTRTVRDLLWNISMLGGSLGARQIDGAYWSLEIELFFYAWMLLVAAFGLPQRGQLWLQLWLAGSVASGLSARLGGPKLPYIVHHVGLMTWIGWFALGMLAYLWKRDGRPGRASVITLVLALAAIGAQMGPGMALFALGCFAAVAAAGLGRLRGVDARVLLWLGALSYPLYLVHQEVGMVSMVLLQRAGMAPTLSIAVAFLVALGLATALHHGVELPVMQALRGAWKRRRLALPAGEAPNQVRAPAMGLRWPRTALAMVLLLATFTGVSHRALSAERTARARDDATLEPVNALAAPRAGADCGADERPPLVVMVLGQSNAASRTRADTPSAAVRIVQDGRCWLAADPLPGTSGGSASIWTALSAELTTRLPQRTPVFAPLAVGATSMRQWTEPGPMREAFLQHLRAIRAGGLLPQVVAWQQGEADMREGTEARHYQAGLAVLRRDLDAAGIRAPLLVARSTYCRMAGSGAIGRAIDRRFVREPIDRVWPGPDTDRLGDDYRYDRCHFDARGREAAARAWADVIVPLADRFQP